MEPVHESPHSIVCLERELVVREFIAALNERRFARGSEMRLLLHEDVVFRPSANLCIHGRDAVIRMCKDLHASFDAFVISIDPILAEDEVVLMEHTIWAKLKTTQIQEVMGFSSFQFQNGLIVEWHQVHA
jgi:limonene-1,2-epoxide hydrolase